MEFLKKLLAIMVACLVAITVTSGVSAMKRMAPGSLEKNGPTKKAKTDREFSRADFNFNCPKGQKPRWATNNTMVKNQEALTWLRENGLIDLQGNIVKAVEKPAEQNVVPSTIEIDLSGGDSSDKKVTVEPVSDAISTLVNSVININNVVEERLDVDSSDDFSDEDSLDKFFNNELKNRDKLSSLKGDEKQNIDMFIDPVISVVEVEPQQLGKDLSDSENEWPIGELVGKDTSPEIKLDPAALGKAPEDARALREDERKQNKESYNNQEVEASGYGFISTGGQLVWRHKGKILLGSFLGGMTLVLGGTPAAVTAAVTGLSATGFAAVVDQTAGRVVRSFTSSPENPLQELPLVEEQPEFQQQGQVERIGQEEFRPENASDENIPDGCIIQ